MKILYPILFVIFYMIRFFFPLSVDAQNCSNQIEVTIEIIPDAYASFETRWKLTDNLGNVFIEGSSEGGSVCVDATQCLDFTITDSFGNGLQGYGGSPGGRFYLYYDGELMATEMNFGKKFNMQFGDCPLGSYCSFPIPLEIDSVYATQFLDDWYVFEPDTSGRFLLTTCDLGNICYTKIWVYDYCEGLEWNDSQMGTIAYSNWGSCGWSGEVNMIMKRNHIYFIRIGGQSCSDETIYWQMHFEGAVVDCFDETACNYNPMTTHPNNSLCVYQGHPNCDYKGPDLIVVEELLKNTFRLEYLNSNHECAIQEGCLFGYGIREILRFDTEIRNIGDKDFYIGKPPEEQIDQGEWEWDDCHNHWHYEGYAEYMLYDEVGNELPMGFKNGFCVRDSDCLNNYLSKYDCSNQGISVGCSDIYDADMNCQWIDVTGLETGNYTLVVRTNWDKKPDALTFQESNYNNNWAKVCFQLDRNEDNKAIVTQLDDCEEILDCLGEVYGTALPDCSGDCEGNLMIGDRNEDWQYSLEDVSMYLEELLNDSTQTNTCTDLNSDGKITIADPALLIACELESSGLHSHTELSHNHCELPTTAIFNPNHTATFSIGELNLSHQYIDIYVTNPNSSILALEMQITGLEIMSIFPSYDTELFDLQLSFNSNGKLFGLTYNDVSFAKNHEPTPFCSIYYTSITEETICIEGVEAVLNQNYEEIEVNLEDTCLVWNDIEVVDKNAPSIHVFPNPFSEFTVFNFKNFGIESVKNQCSLIFMDVNGKVVREYGDLNLTNNSLRVERGDLASGVYFWQFGEERGKVVVW